MEHDDEMEEMSASISRVYADVNQKRPAEYWDYENLSLTW
eukprot:gene36444-44208_t